MKHLKDSLKQMDEKYAAIETLSSKEQHNTYGGSAITAANTAISKKELFTVNDLATKAPNVSYICYGVPEFPKNIC